VHSGRVNRGSLGEHEEITQAYYLRDVEGDGHQLTIRKTLRETVVSSSTCQTPGLLDVGSDSHPCCFKFIRGIRI